MKNRCMEGALACVGAIIGAGFVSGREIMSFFTRFGHHSWWLILISTTVMMLLCMVCMRRAASQGHSNWCALYQKKDKRISLLARLCLTLLLCVIGGAMVSASGHMVELLWPSEWAYSIGAVGTLFVAWLMSGRGTKPLSLASSVLTLLFLGMVVLILKSDGESIGVSAAPSVSIGELAWAAVCAAAYGAMNIAIAIGVVCKTGGRCLRTNDRQSAALGLLLSCLLFLSNYLYLKHPELNGETFPIVRLFAGFGRAGYMTCVILLYLAIFTTLFATVYALRGAMNTFVRSRGLKVTLTLGVPLVVSSIGFMEIVDGLYAPIGLGCLAVVFLPIMLGRS